MILAELFPEAPVGAGDLPVTGLAFDSRRVAPGSVFVAVPGTKVDGSAFIPQALAAGAAAVAGEGPRPANLPDATPYIDVPDVRHALALAAARLYPRQPDRIVAVTGTAGKSSVADFVRQLFAHLGRRSASIGTLGVITSEGAAYGSLTTPDPISLHQTLDRLAGGGTTHLAMEASSHGIEQRRLDGVRLTAAGFTNLGRDHLDYHATMEEYLQAKLRLFETLLPEAGTIVVNADAPESARIAAIAESRGLPILSVGSAGRDIRLLDLSPHGFAQRLHILVQGHEIEADLPLAGSFQAANALVAAGLVMAVEGASRIEAILAGVSKLRGVAGRLEPVGEVDGALCVVDYAHKPEALAQVLEALRPFATGRLVCVFGCGGDRDRGKRPIMGAIAAEKADIVIVTDDNPRSERPAAIRAEILTAAPGAWEIGDRDEAIRTAVRSLRPGDVLVVAGKGHETGQIVGTQVLPFSDHDAIRTAMAEVTR